MTGTTIFSKILLKDTLEKYFDPDNMQMRSKMREHGFADVGSGVHREGRKEKEWEKKHTTSSLLTENDKILHPFSRWREEIDSLHFIGSF